jgi:hypothetical protein
MKPQQKTKETFVSLLLKIESPIKGILSGMYEDKKFTREFFITDESRYKKMEYDLKPILEQKYMSLFRRGKKVVIKILAKGKEEILN